MKEKLLQTGKKLAKKAMTLTLLFALTVTGVTGCGSASGSSGSDGKSSDDVQAIKVGTYSAYPPYCYIDDDGNNVGYEFDVMAELQKKLPQYKIEFEVMDFDDILISLQAGKIDIAACQFEYTDERAETYLFGKEEYNEYLYVLTTLKDNADKYKSIEDLAGQPISAGGTTSHGYQLLQEYNDSHKGKELDLVVSEGTSDLETAEGLRKGVYAASITERRDTKKMNKEFADGKEEFVVVGDENLSEGYAYYVFQKGQEELQKNFDNALKEIKEDGTLEKLQDKWLADYSE